MNKKPKYKISKKYVDDLIAAISPGPTHDRQHSIVDSADHSDKADYVDIPYSPTILTEGVLSEGTNVGTLKVSALTALIRTTDSTNGILTKIPLAKQDNKAIALADKIYYVVLDYNGGTPQIVIQEAEPNNNNQISIGRCMRETDNTVHYRNSGLRLQYAAQKANERAGKLREYEMGCCIAISDEGNKNFAISTGKFFRGINEFLFPGFDSTLPTPDTFTYVYYDGSAWVYVPDQTEIDVDNYNNITTGLKTCNKYKSDWVFVHPETGHVYVVYGQVNNKAGVIADGAVPSDLPDLVDTFGALIGRIIIDGGVTTFYRIEMIQNTTFNPQVVIDHNDNSSIQGGQVDEYYHLTNAQVSSLSNFLENIVEDTTPQLGGELDAGAHTIGFTEQVLVVAAQACSINWENSNKAKLTVDDDVTITFGTNPSKSCSLMIVIVQDGTGGHAVTLPSSIKWAGGIAPILTTAANSIDIVSLYFDGSVYYGVANLDFKTA